MDIEPGNLPIVTELHASGLLRRPRRSRRYSGFRARVATWLRRVADIINPLEES
jgi:hypothetical protein